MSELSFALGMRHEPDQAPSRPRTPSTSSLLSPTGTSSMIVPDRPRTPSTSSTPNPFEAFSVPAIPPRLSKVGRRISELGMNVLIGSDIDDTPRDRRQSNLSQVHDDVPGMGEEPIMCPFCNKPLPPALIISQMAHNHATAQGKRRSQDLIRKTSLRKSSEVGRPGTPTLEKLDEIPSSFPMSGAISAPSSAIQTRDPGAAAGISATQPAGVAPTEGRGSDSVADSILDPTSNAIPKATADSLLPAVKSAETTDVKAASTVISPEEVRRWSVAAGLDTSFGFPAVKVPTTIEESPSAPTQTLPETKDEKPIPVLPPPPPPAERLKKVDSRSESPTSASSRFGNFFRRGSAKTKGDDDDSDDDGPSTSGYAKLDAPPSPDREEKKLDGTTEKRTIARAGDTAKEPSGTKAAEQGKPESEKAVKDTPPSDASASGGGSTVDPAKKEPSVAVSKAQPDAKSGSKDKAKQDAELRKLLAEVLGKVDSMSKSHADLLNSHTTLLTSLKIARSNLAMAEANAEMLEEQLKMGTSTLLNRQSISQGPSLVTTAATPRGGTPQPTAPAIQTTGPAGPTIIRPTPIHASPKPQAVPPEKLTVLGGMRKSLDELRPPAPRIVEPRKSDEPRQRPMSLIIPPVNPNNTGPMTGPATTRPSQEANNGKGMFGFFGGGKTKLPGGLGSITIPSAKDLQSSFDRFGDSLAGPHAPSRPVSPVPPSNATREQQFLAYAGRPRSPVAPGGLIIPSDHERSPARSQSLDQPSPASSTQTARSPSGSYLTSPNANMYRPTPVSPEIAKLRTAQAAAQTRIDAMAKELAELKKGKIEMEAELESLSQALFEEANKMVSDERRKRSELEESLREVKEEREALRQTIKVLGGQVEEKAVTPPEEAKEKDKKEGEEGDEDDKEEDWRPRDLDKHYAALRKTIHHVADGAVPTDAFNIAVQSIPEEDEKGLGLGRGVPMAVFPVNPAVHVSPSVPTGVGAGESNPWAEVDFSGKGFGAGLGAPIGGRGEEGDMDPLGESEYGFGPTEVKGLQLQGVDVGDTNEADQEEEKVEYLAEPRGRMRRTSSLGDLSKLNFGR